MVGYTEYLNATPSGGVAQVEIDSLGGDHVSYLRLLGLTDKAHHRQITVVCRIYGVGLSAGAFFFTAGCDRRVMGPNAVLMYHEGRMQHSLLLSPTDEDKAKTAESLKNINHLFVVHVAAHSHMSEAEVAAQIAKGDWYVQGPEAVARGLADVAQ